MLCDLTQNYSETGGGGGNYLRYKRRYIRDNLDWQHLLVIPGPEDKVVEEGRLITAYVKSPTLPHQPNYRLMLRNKQVRAILDRFRPDVIESIDPYNLPWAALKYRDATPGTATVAGYRTDFPEAHFYEAVHHLAGKRVGRFAADMARRYAKKLYNRFDAVYALNPIALKQFREMGVVDPFQLPQGIDLSQFREEERDPDFRARLGISDKQPLLVYAGRLDREKRVQVVLDAFRRLPEEMGAHLLILGDGKWRQRQIEQGLEPVVHMPGYLKDRQALARAYASSDIYVSAMPYEVAGNSILEAQAAGLPVVGVEAGSMPCQVPPGTGYLGPVDDAAAMAANIERVWREGAAMIGAEGKKMVRSTYSWDKTFEMLFGEVYPTALERRRSRDLGAEVPVGADMALATR
ncbi:glycosyltransferase [Sphingomicrobium aestuariivivum]|uniref:glycosyltransferase n=1 Tax=Sphingomicrobium aestuariivivum TaxID=1582356 RepID=UPI001FD649B8|nr:glycosyltransferase [Sphingomicrobium aestuariivivum]MCJ8190455.1 glycosyltransferase [Sphingomicrobium aestuariivivum]